jgi:hypothetical protein
VDFGLPAAGWIVLVACSRAPKSDPAPEPVPAAIPAKPVVVAPVARPKPAQLAHVTIKALGMYCEESCPLRVRYALAEMPVIYELGFDLDHESIFISYDAALGAPKQVTKPMLTAIKQAGFDPWLAREDWPADAKVAVATPPPR